MKVYGKWLVMGYVENMRPRVAASFMTKKEAIETLDRCFKSKLTSDRWVDSLGQQFYIVKNVKEYE